MHEVGQSNLAFVLTCMVMQSLLQENYRDVGAACLDVKATCLGQWTRRKEIHSRYGEMLIAFSPPCLPEPGRWLASRVGCIIGQDWMPLSAVRENE